jgi:hypothetical protein
MLTIHNVRLGHANNSSSSHSILLLPPGQIAADLLQDDLPEEYGFGWSEFIVASPKGKMFYLVGMFYYKLVKAVGAKYAYLILNSLFNLEEHGVTEKMFLNEDKFSPYVDHQSAITIPSEFKNPEMPNLDFIAELHAWLQHERVYIQGGNDNEDKPEPPLSGTELLHPLRDYAGFGEVVARKDPQGFWTVYNKRTGAKLRFSFGAPQSDATKSSVPELIDLKITNKCPFGCAYCYQESTSTGATAAEGKPFLVHQILTQLAQMEVFEVAIGGGEPTLDAQFPNILETLSEKGVTCNFTTRSTHWIKHPVLFERISKFARSFAFSVDNMASLQSFLEHWAEVTKAYEHMHRSVKLIPAVQLVLGTFHPDEFKPMLIAAADAKVRVTLLGFKNIGFGAKGQPHLYPEWLQVIKDVQSTHFGLDVSIDTALAAQYEAELKEAKVSPWTFHITEGGHSCYIDLVTASLGPSSYSPPADMQKIFSPHNLANQFASIAPTVPVTAYLYNP